jgi:hypothetical protein
MTQAKTSTTDPPEQDGDVNPDDATETVSKQVCFAPTKKRGRAARGTTQKPTLPSDVKSATKLSRLPSRIRSSAKVTDVDSPEVGTEHCGSEDSLLKTVGRVPVRKVKASRVKKTKVISKKCAGKPVGTGQTGDDNNLLKTSLNKSAEVDKKLCCEDSIVTETAYSTPTQSRTTRKGRVEGSVFDESPISTNTSASTLIVKTPRSVSSHRRKMYVFTDSDDDDEVLKALCSKPNRTAKNGVSRCKEKATSSRRPKTVVYVDGDNNTLLTAPATKPSREAGKDGVCTNQTSTTACTRRGLKNGCEADSSGNQEETVIHSTDQMGLEPQPANKNTVASKKGKVSKSAMRKTVVTKTGPAQSLFKDILIAASATKDATIYDFDCSDGGKTPVREQHQLTTTSRKGRLTLKKKSGRQKMESPEIEMVRILKRRRSYM